MIWFSVIFFPARVAMSDTEYIMNAIVIRIPPNNASSVVGTHSGLNMLLSGFRYVIPKFVLLGSPINPPHISPNENVSMPIIQRYGVIVYIFLNFIVLPEMVAMICMLMPMIARKTGPATVI